MKHTDIEIHDIGNRVVCDACNEDYTNSTECGGFLFCSKAYCPKCAATRLPEIRSYGEEHFIKSHCPDGMAFRDWCLQLRNGNNEIRIITTREEP